MTNELWMFLKENQVDKKKSDRKNKIFDNSQEKN